MSQYWEYDPNRESYGEIFFRYNPDDNTYDILDDYGSVEIGQIRYSGEPANQWTLIVFWDNGGFSWFTHKDLVLIAEMLEALNG